QTAEAAARAEVPALLVPVRKRGLRVLGIEREDVERAHARHAVGEVQRRAIAQTGAKYALAIEKRVLAVPGEEVLALLARDREQALQIVARDALVGPLVRHPVPPPDLFRQHGSRSTRRGLRGIGRRQRAGELRDVV